MGSAQPVLGTAGVKAKEDIAGQRGPNNVTVTANNAESAASSLQKKGSPATEKAAKEDSPDRHPMEAGSSSLEHLRQTGRVRIDPHLEFCPFELEGICNDDTCAYQHIVAKK